MEWMKAVIIFSYFTDKIHKSDTDLGMERNESCKRKKAAILGATGVAGQQFIEALVGHPWFEITGLYASERSAGKSYGTAAVWHSPEPLSQDIAQMGVKNTLEAVDELDKYDVVFSALPSDTAGEIEGRCAAFKTRNQHRLRVSLSRRRPCPRSGSQRGTQPPHQNPAERARLERLRRARPQLHNDGTHHLP